MNWTNRQTIPLDRIIIRLTEVGERKVASFSAELTGLRDLGLKPDARVYVEPYVNSSSMRFDFGSIAAITSPSDTALTDLDQGAAILFRVKVVDESDNVGKILASANAIQPEDESDSDNRKALLPVAYRDLGEAIWDLDLAPGVRPVLVLNNRVPAVGDRLRDDPLFQGAIIPHAIRRVLGEVFIGDNGNDEDDWVKDWKAFAAAVQGGQEVDDDREDEELELALNEVVRQFIAQTAWVQRFKLLQEQITGVTND